MKTCVFLDKPSQRILALEADYVGFQVPDEWIIGYGLDFKQEARGLPYIAAVDRSAMEAEETSEEKGELA